MSDDITRDDQEPLSPEAKEALDELRKEGHTIEGDKPADVKAEPKPADKPAEEPAKPTEKVEPKQDPEKPEGQEADKPKAEGDAEPTQVKRTPNAVPVQKHNALRHELQEQKRINAELNEKLAAMSANPTKGEISDVRKLAKELAEKHGMETTFIEEFAEKVVEAAKTNAAIPKDLEQRLSRFEKQERDVEESRAFDADFEKSVVKEFPQLASQKDRIKELAYTEGYENTPLRALAIQFMHDNPAPEPGRKTAESSTQGGGRAEEAFDFDNVTEADLKNPSFPFDKFDAYKQDQARKRRGDL